MGAAWCIAIVCLVHGRDDTPPRHRPWCHELEGATKLPLVWPRVHRYGGTLIFSPLSRWPRSHLASQWQSAMRFGRGENECATKGVAHRRLFNRRLWPVGVSTSSGCFRVAWSYAYRGRLPLLLATLPVAATHSVPPDHLISHATRTRPAFLVLDHQTCPSS